MINRGIVGGSLRFPCLPTLLPRYKMLTVPLPSTRYILLGFCIIFSANVPTKTDGETEKQNISFSWVSNHLLRMVMEHRYTKLLRWTYFRAKTFASGNLLFFSSCSSSSSSSSSCFVFFGGWSHSGRKFSPPPIFGKSFPNLEVLRSPWSWFSLVLVAIRRQALGGRKKKQQVSHEKRAPDWLDCFWEIILPRYKGIIISQYKDPYKPIPINQAV